MVSVQEAKELVMSLLEQNITDPNSERAALNKKWIYDDMPRLDLTHYPRIGITVPAAPLYQFAIGTTSPLQKGRMHIYILVKKKQKLTINNTLMRDQQIIDYLAEQVINTIHNNQSYFYQNGIYTIYADSEDEIQHDDVIIKQIIFTYLTRR